MPLTSRLVMLALLRTSCASHWTDFLSLISSVGRAIRYSMLPSDNCSELKVLDSRLRSGSGGDPSGGADIINDGRCRIPDGPAFSR
ncbi:hypothetical protein B0T26DRAFT_691416 [Lasiosphaeria miniovina]|uniref:Secreted protein n=1 Tax=Lasiosphaeria miniovina TaxID=1954250 RepID=A0AA40BJC1_9PEZI|nr:uncharacterized protein B0T26DRAFT_691416 [Lasiosphaeria miniovina]KAK0735300.1 hypothetical protein B0T26DRAFT_691416 [Lasiosphaeria miniovina]